MRVSILTVTWNSAAHIAEQIASVREAAVGLEVEQLVADNSSNDGTVDILRKKFSNLFLLAFDKNNGFGYANNELAKKASGEYFLLLNPDMKLSPGSLLPLVAWADQHPKAGIIGGKLINPDGDVNLNAGPRRFPSLFEELIILLKLPHIFPSILNSYLMRGFDFEAPQRVDSVQGAFMLVRREVHNRLERLFDPRYFIWFEDVDLCREARRLGYEVWYTPIVSAVDYGGRSFRQKPFLWKQKNFIVSMFKYFQKWGIWRS